MACIPRSALVLTPPTVFPPPFCPTIQQTGLHAAVIRRNEPIVYANGIAGPAHGTADAAFEGSVFVSQVCAASWGPRLD